MTKPTAPTNMLAVRDANRRQARAATPPRLPPQPKTGQAQTRFIKGGR